MSAAHVRRGGATRAKPRKAAARAKGAQSIPAGQKRAGKLAGLAFTGFLFAIGLVVLIALDIPAKAQRSAGAAVGRAGFTVTGYDIVGLNNMERRIVDRVVTDELSRAAAAAEAAKAPQPLVDVAAIRQRLIGFGWIKDARVSRRLPDTLVIDIVERRPAALWQNKGQLALIDAEGVVLDNVSISKMPDLPLLIGPGANLHHAELGRLLASVPTLQPQLASAAWVGRRRWDVSFQSGETIALPEGEPAARTALMKFAKADRANGLLGRGVVRFDLRIPGKMIVRLPRAPGEAITPALPAAPPPQQG
jgi:cell division protein FtsQ